MCSDVSLSLQKNKTKQVYDVMSNRNCDVVGWPITEYVSAPDNGVFVETSEPGPGSLAGSSVNIPLVGDDAETATGSLRYVLSTFPLYGSLQVNSATVDPTSNEIGFLTNHTSVDYIFMDPLLPSCPYDRFGYYVVDELGARSPEVLVPISVRLIWPATITAQAHTYEIDYNVTTVIQLNSSLVSTSLGNVASYLDLTPRLPPLALINDDSFATSAPYSATTTYTNGKDGFFGLECSRNNGPCTGARDCFWFGGNYDEAATSTCTSHLPSSELLSAGANCHADDTALCSQLGIFNSGYGGDSANDEPQLRMYLSVSGSVGRSFSSFCSPGVRERERVCVCEPENLRECESLLCASVSHSFLFSTTFTPSH
jgi:hypothetical protein